MFRRFFFLAPLSLILAACDSGEPGGVSQAEFEGDLGEAIVRHLLQNLPDPAPGVPKSYCLVTGPSIEPMSAAFAKRFADLKLRFLSREVLRFTEPGNVAVDPETGLSPYFVQIASIKSASTAGWMADVGWSYKKTFEKLRYEVVQKDGKYEVMKSTRLEGNYEPPAKRP